MEKPDYTKDEFKKFKKLILMFGSRDQVTRINARLEIENFIKEHGKEKCDAMNEKLKEMGI